MSESKSISEINKEIELTVHSYDFSLIPGNPELDSSDSVHIWSFSRDSVPHLLRVEDFPAFCHLELPIYVNNLKMEWTTARCSEIYNAVCNALQDDRPIGYMFVEKEKAYYYKLGQKFPMLILFFKRMDSMRRLENKMKYPLFVQNYGRLELKVWEAGISSIRKLLSTRDVRYSQWFTVMGTKAEGVDKISTIEHEYIINRKTMHPVPAEKSKSWVTKPKILSFDIETYSNNYKALPRPNDHYHDVFIVSALVKTLGVPGIKKYAVVLGKSYAISGAIIIQVNDELELVRALEKIIIDEDPTILTGYNIFLYDIPYLNIRLKRNIEDWGSIGRLVGVPATVKVKSWESSAYGIQNLNLLNIPGRILVDMYPIIQRDFKLDQYTLDFVSNKFIGKRKLDVKPERMFKAYDQMKTAIKDYNEIVDKVKEKYNIGSEEGVVGLNYEIDPDLPDCKLADWTDFLRICQSELLEEYVEVKKELADAREEMKTIIDYCLRDSELVIGLMEALNVWIGLIELSQITAVTLVTLFTSGQQIRCYNQLYDLAYKRHIVLDKNNLETMKKFKGGFVREPIRGFHINIICLDFSSLYPSIQIAENICASTQIHPSFDRPEIIPDDMCNIIEFEQEESREYKEEKEEAPHDVVIRETEYDGIDIKDENDKEAEIKIETVNKHYRYRYIKREFFHGLIPQLVEELVFQRNVVRKQLMKPIEKEVDKLNDNTIEIELEALRNSMSKLLNQEDLADLDKYIEFKLSKDKKFLKKNKETFSNLKTRFKKYEFSEDVKIKFREIQEKLSVLNLTLIVLDKRQLSLKISANSFFGFLGVGEKGKFSLISAAASITNRGQQLIKQVNEFVMTNYPGSRVCMNDTDSAFLDLRIQDAKDCYKLAYKLQDQINGTKDTPGLFKAPLKMELEKVINVLCVEPKLYAYVEIDEQGNVILDSIDDIKRKGLFVARRGNAKFATATYNNCLFNILKQENVVMCFNIIADAVIELLDGKVPWENFVIIRGLSSSYKSESYFMKVFSEELKKIGMPVAPGSRIPYIICKNGNETLLGKKMKCLEDFTENKYEIDINYYLEHVAQKPIDKLFSIAYNNVLPRFEKVGYKPKSRKHFVCVDKPIQMIARMLEDGVDIRCLKDWFKANYDMVMSQEEKTEVKIRV